MVKNNWSNPELKELSIENTLEVTPYALGDWYKCNDCGYTWKAIITPWEPKYCRNPILCKSTNIIKISGTDDPS